MLPSRKMPATTAYISENASRRAIPVEFSSAGHLRPRDMCTCVYTYTSGACMPRVVDISLNVARTFLYVWAFYMYVYVMSRYTHRTTIHRYLSRPSSRGASRLPCMCMCSMWSSRDALPRIYRLPRVVSRASAYKHVFSARHGGGCSGRRWLLGS